MGDLRGGWAIKGVLTWICLLAGSPAAAVFKEANGLVVVEAENFSAQSQGQVRAWYRIDSRLTPTPTPDPDPSHALTAGGQAYMEILPDTRVTDQDVLVGATETSVPANANFSEIGGKMAVMDYQVEFATPGKYYVWARLYSSGGEDNSMHVGLDGVWPASGLRMQWCDGKNGWYWNSAQRTSAVHCGVPGAIYLDVKTAGLHTVSFSMREDGVELDRWLMTTQAGFTSPAAGLGPEQSKYTGELAGGGGPGPVEFTALKALSDFPSLAIPGFIAPYKDAANGALAINAAVVANRGKFAAAGTVFAGEAGAYDITLVTLGETDGECTYRVVVNGTSLGDKQNAPATQDYGEQQHIWKGVTLAKNAALQVEFNTHSNGKTPEGTGFAWARGRWTTLILAKAATTALRPWGRSIGSPASRPVAGAYRFYSLTGKRIAAPEARPASRSPGRAVFFLADDHPVLGNGQGAEADLPVDFLGVPGSQKP